MTLLALISFDPPASFPVHLTFLFIAFVLFCLAFFWLLSRGVMTWFLKELSLVQLFCSGTQAHTNTAQVPFTLKRKESFCSSMLIFYHPLFNFLLLWEYFFSLPFGLNTALQIFPSLTENVKDSLPAGLYTDTCKNVGKGYTAYNHVIWQFYGTVRASDHGTCIDYFKEWY